MRLKHTVQINASLDTDGKRKLFSDDPSTALTDTEGYLNFADSSLRIEPTVTKALSFGDVAQVRGLYLEVNQEAVVAINGTTAIQLRKAPGALVAKLFLEVAISALSVSNPSTTDVLTGVMVCWGDPTP